MFLSIHRPFFSRVFPVMAFYALSSVLLTFPILLNNATHAAGYDYFHFHWNFWWVRHVLSGGQNLFYTTHVFAPYVNNLAYHTLSLSWYPAWAILEPWLGTFSAMAVLVWGGGCLVGLAMHWWLAGEGVAPTLAIIGALAFQASPTMRYFLYNSHLNLLGWWWLPVHLYLWRRIIHAHTWPAALLWGALMGLGLWGMILTDLQFALFLAFPLGFYGLAGLWQKRKDLLAIIRQATAGLIALAIALALLHLVGFLPALRSFTGTLVPGEVDGRPGIPFPAGYLAMGNQWWEWNHPSMGGFINIAVTLTLLAHLRPAWRIRFAKAGRIRWLWMAAAVVPWLITLGPDLRLGEVVIPLPYRLVYAITSGNFRMPWRTAPVYVFCAVAFITLSWTPFLAGKVNLRRFALVGVAILLLFIDTRALAGGPIRPILQPAAFYQEFAKEPHDYVVVEVPTGVGSGEVIFGDLRVLAFQLYGITHQKRMVNGFIARAPLEHFWIRNTDDPLLSWLGQRRLLDPIQAEARLREIIPQYPVGYIVVHQDYIGLNTPTNQEILAFFNSLPDVLCPVYVDGPAVAYRTRNHPDGCPPRRPPQQNGRYSIDIGDPDDVRYLGSGWHWPESVFDLSVRWAAAEASLYIDLPPTDYTLTVHIQSFHQARQVEILINGQAAGVWSVMPEALAPYTLQIPAAMIGEGQHVAVTFRADGATSAQTLGLSADARPLAVMVDIVSFTGP
jgi:hypothetical protein